jgi:hypothetical protein
MAGSDDLRRRLRAQRDQEIDVLTSDIRDYSSEFEATTTGESLQRLSALSVDGHTTKTLDLPKDLLDLHFGQYAHAKGLRSLFKTAHASSGTFTLKLSRFQTLASTQSVKMLAKVLADSTGELQSLTIDTNHLVDDTFDPLLWLICYFLSRNAETLSSLIFSPFPAASESTIFPLLRLRSMALAYSAKRGVKLLALTDQWAPGLLEEEQYFVDVQTSLSTVTHTNVSFFTYQQLRSTLVALAPLPLEALTINSLRETDDDDASFDEEFLDAFFASKSSTLKRLQVNAVVFNKHTVQIVGVAWRYQLSVVVTKLDNPGNEENAHFTTKELEVLRSLVFTLQQSPALAATVEFNMRRPEGIDLHASTQEVLALLRSIDNTLHVV